MAGSEMTILPLPAAKGSSLPPQPQLALHLPVKYPSKSLAIQNPKSFKLRHSHYSVSPALCRFGPPIRALDSDASHARVHGVEKANTRSRDFHEWDSLTAKFAGAANVPFLLLQLPQIILNARNLMAGNKAALYAVPWLGMLTGLLGNLSLLSYFAKKKETEAVLVQTLGVVSTYAVITQLAMAGSMPLPHFAVTTVVVASGLILNFLNYFNFLHPGIWLFWEDFITVGGLAVLPQVMWSTFVPFLPNSILPGVFAFALAVVAVVMARSGKLSEKAVKFVASLSGWTATLLFMWMPVAQMWTSYLNPDNIKGLSAFSMLLAMIGNGLMIPRALFTRDLMWFTGSAWASFLHGWGNLICMYCFKSISKEFFLAATVGFLLWLGDYYILVISTIQGYFADDNEFFVDDESTMKLVGLRVRATFLVALALYG